VKELLLGNKMLTVKPAANSNVSSDFGFDNGQKLHIN
jgi:hypothetical protein